MGSKRRGLKTFLRKAGVFCRRRYATWDVLLPSRELAAKLASSHITTKFFRLQPEYLETRRIRVTVCNVPAFITREVLVAFLSAFGCLEEINLLRSAAGTAYGDYVFRLCLTREGFQAIPEIIVSRERRMMVVVVGRCRDVSSWGTSQSFALKRPSRMLQYPQTPQSPRPPSAASSRQRLQLARNRDRYSLKSPINPIKTKAGPRYPGKKESPQINGKRNLCPPLLSRN